ncbi:MAG: 16S rRNA (cytosine(1402)-N(4))-methyltransferase RsmH [Ignavibacteriales bacterium CG_4_9_14_3_um_filter_30_11]|nr:MAG: 16S rRNA (cytosine(1402)-N(4))-methyltransferase RsmH [Ignavibacteriales bacterium CG_4_9_14_3_um_filter_30_11]
MGELHSPVLLNESIDYLITDKSGIYFDGTLGFGGHSSKILESINNDGLLVSTDVDLDAFNFSRSKFGNKQNMKLYNFNFSKIKIISKLESIKVYNGIFADLGISSHQIDDPASGFTFREEAELDLRMDKTIKLTAAELINTFAEDEISSIFYEFGEEKNSRKIARRICEKRRINPIKTTTKLAEIISELVPERYLNKTLSRIFQSIRIYINKELEVLKTFLDESVDLLAEGGRIVILTYHSLEDRIVKEKFQYEELKCVCPKDYPVCSCNKTQRLKILTRKPVYPSDAELSINRRARSAKLRAAVRL